jgi:hypothetical protein
VTIVNLGLASCLIGIGALVVTLALPMARGVVRRRDRYGFRFPEALASDEAFVDINRFGGRRLIPWGVAIAGAGVATLLAPPIASVTAGLAVSLIPSVIVIPYLQTRAYARRWDGRR